MRLAYLSDLHFGKDEDLRAFWFARFLLRKLNIDEVFLGGDIFDHAPVSRYKKSLEIEGQLQQEIDHGVDELAALRDEHPRAKFHFLPGNHEKRLLDYLTNNARALESLRALQYRNIYSLDDLCIDFHEEGQPVKIGHLWLAHGHEFPTGGLSAAKTALDKVNSNVLFGHVHKLTVAHKTELGGRCLQAQSNPCLSTLTPDYTLQPDWVQGFSVVDFTRSGYFKISPYTFWRDEETGCLNSIVEGQHYKERKPRGTKKEQADSGSSKHSRPRRGQISRRQAVHESYSRRIRESRRDSRA